MTVINGKLGGKGRHAEYMIRHLTRLDQNDRVDILEIDPSLPSQTIEAALTEWQTLVKSLTRSEKGFYEANINPRENEVLTREQWIEAANILEEKLGFTGQPRLIVQHEKLGREHIHVLWQSTIVEQGKVISDSHNYRKHEEAAMEIVRRFDLEPSPRKHGLEKDVERPRAEFTQQDKQKAERSGIEPKDRNAFVTEAYEQSKTGGAFVQALENEGYYLARGDRKNIFMLVDPQFEAHKLGSCINGAKVSEIKQFLAPLKVNALETVSEVIEQLKNPEHALDRAEEINKTFEHRLDQLKEQQEAQKSQLSARHEAENQIVEHGKKAEEPRGLLKLVQQVTGYAWFKEKLQDREDRERLASQQIERDRQSRDHKNELLALERERREELSKLDEIHRENARAKPRFHVSISERRLNTAQERVSALREYDQNDTALQDIEQSLITCRRRQEQHEYKEGLCDILRQGNTDRLNELYSNGEEARALFEEKCQESGIRKALKALADSPLKYGELNNPPQNAADHREQQRQFDTLSSDMRREHYLRKNLENTQRDKEWNEGQIALLQRQKMKLISEISDERMALMRLLQKEAQSLEKEQWESLGRYGQRELRNAREMFKDAEKRDRAETAIREYGLDDDRVYVRKRDRDERDRDLPPPNF